MPTRRFAETTPDLFSVTPAKAPRPAASHGNPKPDKLASRSRNLLPKDLAGALKHLDDAGLDALLAAVTTEARRRGWLRPSQAKERQTRQAEDGSALTSGQLNAVRAAFKAGVKPSAIARQFRISQSEVRKALAPGRRGRTSSP